MPIREGYAREVFIVSSGEMMALYAANNIAQAVRNFASRGYARLGGLILNARNIADEQEIVAKAAEEIGIDVIHYVPRCGDIQKAEAGGGIFRSGRSGAGDQQRRRRVKENDP